VSFERVVLVTGAASGIGAATALRLAAPGTALALTTRGNADGLAQSAATAGERGATVETVLADLAETGGAGTVVGAAREAFGRIDQLVSNAGKAEKTRFGEFGTPELDRAFAVNTRPFLELVTAARADLERSYWGRVVAISSLIVNDIGINGVIFPATAAAKAATETLARTLAVQLAPLGVTVNCVAPGFTRKVGGHAALGPAAWEAAAAATPSGRIAEPDDIAAAVAFFLSREACHVTGQILRVDGGLSL
jgi:NAD(P)-dependent dehydrogenase (short-subunit alcohol dehydrogenase family)